MRWTFFIIIMGLLSSSWIYSSTSTQTVKVPESQKPEGHEHQLQYGLLFNKKILRPQKVEYKYNEPADLIDLVPILRDLNELIPRRFSLAEHEFILDPRRITIRHEWMDVQTRAHEKHSIISLSYMSTGVTFGSQLDVPLFYTRKLGFTAWSAYPLGNYTMTFDRNRPYGRGKALFIRALTRF